ncbi:uncharacterized protein K460DRAFT_13973 [Cucurbitaria berberidis CBS 394.84]|uniref:Uncharacterized protein n=1 Tax=Cucurbitaria berberidis CBS 394.84 TaxID=1168544 RepID=A0A9P4GS76_9PLEO|nr:uncharacterized protein K460DRAFT_13973 [Cucurbitaria berberidis CBS 394.84]KAF1850329.1 hypothetical protein K460DRAFT_13973 [Cucurbitaria berberidis CBS 394.84]
MQTRLRCKTCNRYWSKQPTIRHYYRFGTMVGDRLEAYPGRINVITNISALKVLSQNQRQLN